MTGDLWLEIAMATRSMDDDKEIEKEQSTQIHQQYILI